MINIRSLLIVAILFISVTGSAQLLTGKHQFTHADSVRGSITPERVWWNVLHYTISVTPDLNKKSLTGETTIRWQAKAPGQTMQIDLQQPMRILSIVWRNRKLTYTRDSNAFYVKLPRRIETGHIETITIKYEGIPHEAVNPPWDGGWIWKRDEQGRPWAGVACEGAGASLWYPCKDHLSDEPDSGAVVTWTVPDTLVAVGNGRLKKILRNGNGTTSYTWAVVNPINNYNITTYIGKYAPIKGWYQGLKGKLDYTFWMLDYNLEKGRTHLPGKLDTMLHAFEYWMGPYPFYEDGYQLAEALYAGMEHQTAIAYSGLGYGVWGMDISSTQFWNIMSPNSLQNLTPTEGNGWSMKFDYMLVHESGHEWFGNSITAKDIADMWIHESFTTYSEALYLSYVYGVEAGNDYIAGFKRHLLNRSPVIGAYDVNNSGSIDMYFKGAVFLHMIKQITGDAAFRLMLLELGSRYYHQTVTAHQVESIASQYARRDLSPVFNQYLRTTQVPVLEYKTDGKTISYRYTNCIEGFNLPVKVYMGGLPEQWITPTKNWQQFTLPVSGPVIMGNSGTDVSQAQTWVGSGGFASAGDGNLSVNRNFYIQVKKVN